MGTFQRKTACNIYFPMNLLERSVLWGRGGLYHICKFSYFFVCLFIYLFVLVFINFFFIFYFYFINHRKAMAYPTAYPMAYLWPRPWPTPGFVPTQLSGVRQCYLSSVVVDQNRINVNRLVGTHQRLACIVTYSLVVTCYPED